MTIAVAAGGTVGQPDKEQENLCGVLIPPTVTSFRRMKPKDSHVELLTDLEKGQRGQPAGTPQYMWIAITGIEEKKKRERKGFERHALFTRVGLC
jgi:hypothetical protein